MTQDARAAALNRAIGVATESCRRLIAQGADEQFIDAAWAELGRAFVNATEARWSLGSSARTLAWHLRGFAREVRGDLRTGRPAAKPAPVFALALPRMSNHLVDMLPLAAELKSRGREVLFGAPLLAEEIAAAGFELDPMNEASPAALLLELTALTLGTAAAVGRLASAGDPNAGVVLMPLLSVVRPFVRYRRALMRLLANRRPRLLLVGNPNTLEGRIAARLGAQQRIPVVALQHGSIPNGDKAWSRSEGVQVFAWGEASREALMDSGLSAEQVHVTGAMRLDAQARSAHGGPRSTVVVASSGAGHQVGLEEHLRFIEIVYQAAAAVPQCRWVAKLHPKDKVELYDGAAKRWPSAKVEVHPAVWSKQGADIFDYLGQAHALVTVVSTSALDAIVSGVPVISVQGTAEQRRDHEFIRAGAVKVVTSADQLGAALGEVLAGAFPARIQAAAERQRERSFANVGRATRVAADLCEKMGG